MSQESLIEAEEIMNWLRQICDIDAEVNQFGRCEAEPNDLSQVWTVLRKQIHDYFEAITAIRAALSLRYTDQCKKV